MVSALLARIFQPALWNHFQQRALHRSPGGHLTAAEAEDGLEGSPPCSWPQTSWLFVFPLNVVVGAARCSLSNARLVSCLICQGEGVSDPVGRRLRKWGAGVSAGCPASRAQDTPHSSSILGSLPLAAVMHFKPLQPWSSSSIHRRQGLRGL